MTVPAFTELERKVLRIGLTSGEPAIIMADLPPGRWERLRRLVFGHRPFQPLADARLEALRAMAAAIRDCPDRPDPGIVAAFIAAGWQHGHIGVIRQST